MTRTRLEDELAALEYADLEVRVAAEIIAGRTRDVLVRTVKEAVVDAVAAGLGPEDARQAAAWAAAAPALNDQRRARVDYAAAWEQYNLTSSPSIKKILEKRMDLLQPLIARGPGPEWDAFTATLPGFPRR